jgi:hypothetical protein
MIAAINLKEGNKISRLSLCCLPARTTITLYTSQYNNNLNKKHTSQFLCSALNMSDDILNVSSLSMSVPLCSDCEILPLSYVMVMTVFFGFVNECDPTILSLHDQVQCRVSSYESRQ